METRRVHATLDAAARRCEALLAKSIQLKQVGQPEEATAVLAKIEKLQGQISALERALQAWRRY